MAFNIGRRLTTGSWGVPAEPTGQKSGSDGTKTPVSDEETVVDDSEKNVLMSIISQLRPGADLSRITLPTFILEPRSMLERITNFMQHPENLTPLTTVENPEERFLAVVKFYLSGWHIKPVGVKKPLNPVLGEFFTCYWNLDTSHQAFYIAEQTSHHPPKSSYFYMAPQHHIRIDGTLKPQSRFLGNSAASMMNTSVVVMRLLNQGPTGGQQGGGEKYILTQPNMYVRGILFGKMKYELGDHAHVRCPEQDLVCDVEFKVKGFFTGTYNAIGGTIKRESTGEVLYEISGSWSGEMWVRNCLTGKKELLFDATHAVPTPPLVKPIADQEERESQRLWQHVVRALNDRNQEVATDEKFKIEDRQREEARMRENDGVEWHPRFFRRPDPAKGEEGDLDWIIAAHIDETATPEEQIRQILSIAPVIEKTDPTRKGSFAIPAWHEKGGEGEKLREKLKAENGSRPDAQRSATGELIDFVPENGAGYSPDKVLVPTSAGIAPAGKLSGLGEMASLKENLPAGGSDSGDDFHDANEK